MDILLPVRRCFHFIQKRLRISISAFRMGSSGLNLFVIDLSSFTFYHRQIYKYFEYSKLFYPFFITEELQNSIPLLQKLSSFLFSTWFHGTSRKSSELIFMFYF